MQAVSVKQRTISWVTLSRFGAAARGMLPFLIGVSIAWSQGYPIKWAVLLLSILAVFFVMLMTNLINEYYDYEADVINKGFHSLSGGSRVLPLGLIQRSQAFIAAHILLVLSGIIGLVLYFYYHTGWLTIPLGALAIFVGYFYTAKPLQWSYRGLGELAIWFSCGWLATIMGYYLQVGHIDKVATLVSLPGAFSIFLVILINEIPDIDADRLVGKRNLAAKLGKEKAAILYSVVLILCYINIIAIIFFGIPKLSALLSLILLPFIGWNILALRKKGNLENTKVLEAISLRTMLIDHLITFIYIAVFIIAGLGLRETGYNDLVIIGALAAVIFAFEGLGVFCSNLVRKW